MNTYLFYVQLIFITDMLTLIRCRYGLQMDEKPQDVEHGQIQIDSKGASAQEIRLSGSQIAVLDKAEFLILF